MPVSPVQVQDDSNTSVRVVLDERGHQFLILHAQLRVLGHIGFCRLRCDVQPAAGSQGHAKRRLPQLGRVQGTRRMKAKGEQDEFASGTDDLCLTDETVDFLLFVFT